jgi:soluble lytic murein transglycosylase-like protein
MLARLKLTDNSLLALFAARLSPHTALIDETARRHRLDPYVVAAIILVESGGRTDVVNDFHAVGLMQVVARENPNPVFKGRPTAEQLKDPAANLEWGCQILAANLERSGDLKRALYNYSGGSAWSSFETFEARYWVKVQRYRSAFAALAGQTGTASHPDWSTLDKLAEEGRWWAEEALRALEAGDHPRAELLQRTEVIPRLYQLERGIA